MKKVISISLIVTVSVLTLFLMNSFGRHIPSTSGNGMQLAKLPVPMIFPKVVQGKGKYFVISQGNSEKFRIAVNIQVSNTTDTQVIVYEFNPSNASLRKLTDAPFFRNFFGACINGSKIYIAGGYDANWVPTKTVFEYDLTSKKWTTKKPMSAAHTHFALECVDGKIYAIGGEGINGPGEMYKQETDTWIALKTKYIPANLKFADYITCSSVMDNKIYLFGKNIDIFQIYKPVEDIQVEGPSSPFKSEFFEATVYSKRMYVSGGSVDGKLNGGVHMYDIVEGMWSTVGKIPVPRYGSGLMYYNNMLMFLGGSTSEISSPAIITDEIFIYRPMK